MPQRIIILPTSTRELVELTAWCHRHDDLVAAVARDPRSALGMLCEHEADRLLIPRAELWRELLPDVRVLGEPPLRIRPRRLR